MIKDLKANTNDIDEESEWHYLELLRVWNYDYERNFDANIFDELINNAMNFVNESDYVM